LTFFYLIFLFGVFFDVGGIALKFIKTNLEIFIEIFKIFIKIFIF